MSHCLGHGAYRIEEVAYRTLWDESTYHYTPNVHKHLYLYITVLEMDVHLFLGSTVCRSLLCICGAIAICELF